MDKHFSYALSFLSNDSKGLVSEAAKVLLENGFNIADSSSTLMHGVFSMIFVVTSNNDFSESQVQDMFRNSPFVPNVFKFTHEEKEPEGIAYSISVYGADKPGIVHEITSVLAKYDINISDLQTKITGSKNSKVYIMMLEASVPENLDENIWIKALKESAKNIGTDVTIKKIETYEF